MKVRCSWNQHERWRSWIGDGQCSRLKSPMPFKHDSALQNIPLSQRPFKMQPQIENEDVTWSPQFILPATWTNERRALSLQAIELDGWFLILHMYCTGNMYRIIHAQVSYEFCIFISIFLDSTSWIWTNPSTEGLKFESPSKWNSYEGFNLDHWRRG